MRVAIVHDWLTGMRGGERCLETFLTLYPQADVHTLVHVPGRTSAVIDAHVRSTSWLQRVPGIATWYRHLLPFYPLAVRSIDLRGYDLVISLSHAAAKNIRVAPGVPHICYCFTPMRYVWDQARSYFGVATPLLTPVLRALRRWDYQGAQRVDHFVAISRFIAARIRCFYGKRATVLFPPVDTSWIRPASDSRPGEAFLYAGALVPYKRPELAIEACARVGAKLWIAGSGPEEERLRKLAGPEVTFFGAVSDSELAELYAHCRALLFPGTEDFGMVPIECLAAGRPIIARHAGALRETLTGIRGWEPTTPPASDVTGVFFRDIRRMPGETQTQTREREVDALVRSIELFGMIEGRISREDCVRAAGRFSPRRFFEEWQCFLGEHDLPPLETSVPELVSAIRLAV